MEAGFATSHLASGASASCARLRRFARCLNLSCGCGGVAKKLLVEKDKEEEEEGERGAGRRASER